MGTPLTAHGMAKSKTTTPQTTPRRHIRCYLCGHHFDVSGMTMSVPCPRCNKALKVEDVHVKTYVPVNDLQTCGRITVAKNGRVVAKVIRAGAGIECDGTLEGAIEADNHVTLTGKSTWKGKTLQAPSLVIDEGAKLLGHVRVPWQRPVPPPTATTPGRAKPAATRAATSSAGATASSTVESKPAGSGASVNGEGTAPSSVEEPAMP
jgi:hypothetical protein